ASRCPTSHAAGCPSAVRPRVRDPSRGDDPNAFARACTGNAMHTGRFRVAAGARFHRAPIRAYDRSVAWRGRFVDMALTLEINGAAHRLDVEPETPLLWVLR